MPRYKLTVEYDGSPFVGWQRQANGLAVQQAIEEAAAPLGGARNGLRGAGRTDAGVHATGQVAHLDLPKPYRPDSVRDALNARLASHPIAIVTTEAVADDFDARFSATRRHYCYRICNRRAPAALDANRVWLVKRPLDAPAMHAAAQHLLGRHDFSTFRDSDCQAASPVRTLDRCDVTQDDDAITVRVSAQSFLHRQVRSMVGSLEHVGAGRWSAADLRAALDAADRSRCGQVAPAAGLYLVSVDY
ncbi:tRNA pseudouridine(38-40) synthase TruA [Lichenihabitans sp. Uapishka_5]|uniref:tRNA pseudouridine(38-40) synthase TruA n=1 Tax=Lichenihabitans sp. Uapishka_5 TaxID=3037302 RepID=UPI0029E81E09|nr:tRNA pseudouridine(38-40) synthase TruA [Lichenihabitans sp. Uapishka_5]MDX7950943.1 tRNA pseudouridine(38-40) synthase TruA [Lichenihabitans sp. Uapishka_5]